ncbi:putative ferric-chelate reductase 1 [Portunus trituberculatus]|uniref:putative ferric-chelate reductase 1 n=1 Tax=Portunus trituberculatus TaxID=210409 RepID=UPI001E1CC974|nr:putative ferric-chelate reductase 1 [Portunus trituberculatus]
MNRLMIVCGVATLFVMGITAHPRGAPSSVCDDPFMEPIYHRDHLNATPYNNTDEYTLQSAPIEGRPGIVRVTLTGPRFKGFVVRASTTGGEINQGQFIIDEDSDFHALHCSNNTDIAVTHSSPEFKDSVQLLLRDNNNGSYVFQATVVPTIETYYINIFES